MINAIFIAAYFIIDMILALLFKNDFAMNGLVFMPCVSYCGLLLIAKHEKPFNAIFMAFTIGIITDFINGDHILLCALIYVFTAIIYYNWSKHLSESLFEVTLILLVMIFIKEVFIYGYYIFSNSFDLSFSNFAESRLFITVIGNIIPLLFLILIDNYRKDVQNYQERVKRNNEDLFGTQFK